MDESAIKGLELNGSDLDALKARKSRSVRLLVKGYDTSVHVDCVKSALREHFSSCGEIVCVSNSYYEDGTPTRIAEIYIMGDGAEEKALQLSGSEMGGRKLVVTSLSTDCIKLTPEMAARSKMILVKGFDTSLPEDDIKSALTNHSLHVERSWTLLYAPTKFLVQSVLPPATTPSFLFWEKAQKRRPCNLMEVTWEDAI